MASYGAVPARFTRPGVITGIVVFDVLVGGLYLLAGVAGAVAGRESAATLVIGVLLALMGVVHLAAAAGLFLLAPWGRWLQFALCALGLLGFPCGTLLYGLMLYYLTRPGIAVVFSGRAPSQLAPHEWDEVNRGAGNSGLVLIAAAALALLMIPMLGIVAAIAIPSLLRARVSANEAAAIGCVRSVISAEAAYQGSNAGFYDNLDCLRAPSRCIPNYAASQPVFLQGCNAQERGYRFTFHPGPAAEGVDATVASPSSLTGYAIVAEPVTRNTTGVRSFCGDASGVVCAETSEMSPPEDGACPASCSPLR